MSGLRCYRHDCPWPCTACVDEPDIDGRCGACRGSHMVNVYTPGIMTIVACYALCPKCATGARKATPENPGTWGCCRILCDDVYVVPCALCGTKGAP